MYRKAGYSPLTIRTAMKNDEHGTTDVLSSLPIIACCIFAVMILVAAIGQSAGGRGKDEGLSDSCNALLEQALKNMTVRSEDGRHYLDKDWRERAAILAPVGSEEGTVSSAIEVRLLGENTSMTGLSGNIGGCRESFSASAPVLLITGNICIPGEIIARVGR